LRPNTRPKSSAFITNLRQIENIFSISAMTASINWAFYESFVHLVLDKSYNLYLPFVL
jgi:hypothetical protein